MQIRWSTSDIRLHRAQSISNSSTTLMAEAPSCHLGFNDDPLCRQVEIESRTVAGITWRILLRRVVLHLSVRFHSQQFQQDSRTLTLRFRLRFVAPNVRFAAVKRWLPTAKLHKKMPNITKRYCRIGSLKRRKSLRKISN